MGRSPRANTSWGGWAAYLNKIMGATAGDPGGTEDGVEDGPNGVGGRPNYVSIEKVS